MEKVSVCNTLDYGVDVASVSKIPTTCCPQIIKKAPSRFFLIFSISRPSPSFENYLDIKFNALFSALVLFKQAIQFII